MKPVMNKKPIVLGVVFGLLLWALLIGSVAAVLAQEDADPFATVTPETVEEATEAVTPESTEEVIVVPTDPTIVDEVQGEIYRQLPGLINSMLILGAVVLLTVTVTALILVYRSSPPWLQTSIAPLFKHVADGIDREYQRARDRARLTETPIDDILTDAPETFIKELLDKLRSLDQQVQAVQSKLDALNAPATGGTGAQIVTRPLDNDPLALG
jgi:hypothetical protein